MKHPLLASMMALSGLAAADSLPLIPQPVSVKPGEGAFDFTAATGIRYDRTLKAEADLFAADLQKLTGNAPKTASEEMRILLPSEIRLDVDAAADLPVGGYKLEITPKTVVVTGKDAAGAYYGTRTLLQLLPAANDPAWKDQAPEKLPAVSISDYPRFAWRGMMLDCGRHFFEVKDVKRFIDELAYHKLNVFHWHLTEDQGWRIEIKKYPKLTETGSWRESSPPYGNRNSDDGKRYGGFYTQEQVKDIVAYATARHITVVPEIEMPGHAAAAITAYPKLGNDDIPGYAPKVMTRWGVHPYTFAPTEDTFRFIDDVFTEVCALFPSKYIHIGGDEAPKDQWDKSPRVQELKKKENLKDGHDVQSYFVKRVEKILAKKGRKLIGWDEIREGGLSPEATVMSWRGEKGGIDSAKEGHDVVMAANSHLYFDHYQEPKEAALAKGGDKEAIGGFLPLSKVYSYDPVPKALTAAEGKHVLGVQAQLWAEYFHDFPKMEYMAFPRIAALAEIAWTPLERKNFEDFRGRLDGVLKHYDAAGLKHGDPDQPK
ncbi:beta-N-acetylhexosaminidase [Luteolibacter sp. LG18]|uniref:beta-N-acetylhexosaminidase n=1 Tax=Luteolibacter sp. LG18 TaxID=2819286 RepID=UPI0030C732AF